MCILTLFTSDSSLGKVDKSFFSQQTLMELFIDEMTPKDCILGVEFTSPYLKDIGEWAGIVVTEGTVASTNWDTMGLEGSIRLEYLLMTAERVDIQNNRFAGTVSLQSLHEGIIDLNLFSNSLRGSLDFTRLPDSLKSLNAHANRFTGSIDLTHLPAGMNFLDLGRNCLSGTLDFTNLPLEMDSLYLQINNFSGSCDFSHLPPSLKFLSIAKTKLEGVIWQSADMHVSALGTQLNVLKTT
mmetsp:Transcript_19484/g.30531  ORF Transcript_19484/g.30531 Transcript_19484/m.30531 type:complete len:240 (-) Transcript_19484:43-762(-)